ncbi:Protein SERAC1-like protein [Hapsidospora chrysogenum ATCC 11550]|uniref:Protein SERAC1-like protein n=1 Tax=Hapsidospora chrysogenum (strain ATCC 11550 / CBS 779.69 / DSM 880 / IAM 14645 / JCM 23072 / IMI 49137) TaxID=857340 RepID=A0A086T3A2_HAPC1|nr:Protein SERAC1-like protein [Hapsidospora chrysogenum ATCC 11550]
MKWRFKRRKTAPEAPQGTALEITGPQAALSTNPQQADYYQAPFPDGVRILHDVEDATVDICFIHGLAGNRDSTWTAKGQEAPWPAVLLPSEIPKARILTYGYDASVVRKSAAISTNRLIDHAGNLLTDLTNDRQRCNAVSRPLMFVAHSMGGLVCKKALLLSRNHPEPHLRGIFDSLEGILFMGSPHKGSWIADWANIPVSALGALKSTNKPLLEALGTDNQFLEGIQHDFLSMLREQQSQLDRKIQIACFFEELPTYGNKTVVSQTSATLEGYTSLSIHANHRDMVKFATAEDNGFQRVSGELRRWQKTCGKNQRLDRERYSS